MSSVFEDPSVAVDRALGLGREPGRKDAPAGSAARKFCLSVQRGRNFSSDVFSLCFLWTVTSSSRSNGDAVLLHQAPGGAQ